MNAQLQDATIGYFLEPIDAVLEEIKPLLLAHWQEIARYPDIPLEPDWEQYRKAEVSRALRIFTARIAMQLIGYAVYFVTPGLHYKSTVQATQDILFLAKDYRRGGVGRDLIRHADHVLRVQGVKVVYHHVKARHNFGPLLERDGYELVDLIYGKRL